MVIGRPLLPPLFFGGEDEGGSHPKFHAEGYSDSGKTFSQSFIPNRSIPHKSGRLTNSPSILYCMPIANDCPGSCYFKAQVNP